jgi:hypothetical protein
LLSEKAAISGQAVDRGQKMKLPVAAMICALCCGVAMVRPALSQHAEYDALVASHAKDNGVPEALVHRLIKRESGYQAGLVGRGGTIGLMQIKLGTARSMGYTGTAEGLRDPATNLTYAVKYLAGAFLAAKGDHGRTISYYSAGYYTVAKQQRAAHHHNVAAAKPAAATPATATTATPAVASTAASVATPATTSTAAASPVATPASNSSKP